MSCNLLFHEMSLKKHSAIAGCIVPFEEWPVKPGLHSEQLLIVKANYLLLFLFSGNTEHLAPNCSIFFAVYSWNFKYSSSVKNDCHSYHEKKKKNHISTKKIGFDAWGSDFAVISRYNIGSLLEICSSVLIQGLHFAWILQATIWVVL